MSKTAQKTVQVEIPAHVYNQWLNQQPTQQPAQNRNQRRKPRRQHKQPQTCSKGLWGKCCDFTNNLIQSTVLTLAILFFMFLGEKLQPFSNVPILSQLTALIFGTSV